MLIEGEVPIIGENVPELDQLTVCPGDKGTLKRTESLQTLSVSVALI